MKTTSKVPVKVPKLWTKTEKASAKLSITLSYRYGQTKVATTTILRPAKMLPRHLTNIIFLISTYGTNR